MSDETDLSSSESNTEETNDQSLKSGADAETSETEGKEKTASVPSYRLREETEKRKEAEKVSAWYRDNIGDPEDVIAFRQWKAGQAKAAPKEADSNEELTDAQIKAVEKLVSRAFPWMKEIDPAALKEVIQSKADAREVMEVAAVEEVNKLADAAGIPKEQEDRDRVAYLVGAEIARDSTLDKLWKAGNMSAITKAFERVKGFYRGNGAASQKDAQTRRQVTKLPTTPAGGSATVSARNPAKREKGLDGKAGREAADEAWAVLNQET